MSDSIARDNTGPMEAHVKGYQPMRDQRAANGVITITGHMPEYSDVPQPGEFAQDWKARLREMFGRDAKAILHVLANNLPGGTMHQLLIEMLRHKTSLFVVCDQPEIIPARLNIEKLAVAYVHEAGNWGVFKDREADGEIFLSSDPWTALCRAVEAKYGDPPVIEIPIPDEIASLIFEFDAERVYVKDDEGRQVTALMASTDVPGLLLIQVDQDNSEWYLVKKEELQITPF